MHKLKFIDIISTDGESVSLPIKKELLDRQPKYRISCEGEIGDTIELPCRASDGEMYLYKFILEDDDGMEMPEVPEA